MTQAPGTRAKQPELAPGSVCLARENTQPLQEKLSEARSMASLLSTSTQSPTHFFHWLNPADVSVSSEVWFAGVNLLPFKAEQVKDKDNRLRTNRSRSNTMAVTSSPKTTLRRRI